MTISVICQGNCVKTSFDCIPLKMPAVSWLMSHSYNIIWLNYLSVFICVAKLSTNFMYSKFKLIESNMVRNLHCGLTNVQAV